MFYIQSTTTTCLWSDNIPIMVSGRWQINEQNEQINLLIENKAHYKFLPTFQASLICSIVSISVQHNILEENWGESSSKIRTKFIMCHKFITIRKSYAHHTHTPKTFIIFDFRATSLPLHPPLLRGFVVSCQCSRRIKGGSGRLYFQWTCFIRPLLMSLLVR